MSTAPSPLVRPAPSRGTSRSAALRAASAWTLALVGALCLGALPGAASVASAASKAKVTFVNDVGTHLADTTYSTTLTVSGTGFQSIKNGFGGIYVAFGVVDGRWRPSQGGASGTDYRYVPDSQTKDNAGYQKFVAFPGSDTGSAANGGTIAADGTWRTTLVVPGPTIQVAGEGGDAVTVDCRKSTCGIITIGAHGQANAHNETFTPVTFGDVYSDGGSGTDPSASSTPTSSSSDRTTSTPDPAGSTSSSSSAGATPSGTTTPGTSTSPGGAAASDGSDGSDAATTPQQDAADASTTAGEQTASGSASVEVDRTAAVAGHVLAFTATGFQQGEQVTAVLDDGLAAVGPITVGLDGATAGVVTLPADLQAGTHTLTVTGATSGSVAHVSFGARAATAPTAAPAAADPAVSPWAWAVVVAGAVALLGVVVWRLVPVLRARRSRKA